MQHAPRGALARNLVRHGGTHMKTLLRSAFVVALGLVVARVSAEEMQWRPVSGPAPSATTPSGVASPGLTLQRPVPLNATAPPANLVPTNLASVARGKIDAPRPLPAGSSLNQDLSKPLDDPKPERIPVA